MGNVAIQFTGAAELEIARQAIPEPGPGEFVVEATKSLISTGTECICYNRWFEPGTHWDRWVKYPFSPGYSSAGVVRAVGSGVQGVKVGQRVAGRKSHAKYWKGRASELGVGVVTVPEGVSDEAATWFGIGSIVQVGVRAAEHRLGDDVVVIGCGILGQVLVQDARLCGARTVVVVDISEIRLKTALDHGATHAVSEPVDQCQDAVADATDGRMGSVVYDVTGNANVLSSALGLARDFGTVVILGDTGVPSGQKLTSDVITRGLRIVGAHDAHPPRESTRHTPWSKDAINQLFFTYLQRGDMRVDDLITHRHDPRDARSVYDGLSKDRSQVLGVIFDWTLVDG